MKLTFSVMAGLVAASGACAVALVSSCTDSPGGPKNMPPVEAGKDCTARVDHGRMQVGPSGACVVICDGAYGHCGTSLTGPCDTNISKDNANCGGCGNLCDPLQPCNNGTCKSPDLLYQAPGVMVPGGLAVTPTHIFFMNKGVLFKLARGDIDPTVLASNSFCPLGLTTDGVYVYWPNCSTYDRDAGLPHFDGKILRVRISGGPVETVAARQNPIEGIEQDGNSVYWLNGGAADGGATSGGIASAPNDGGVEGGATLLAAADVPHFNSPNPFRAKVFGRAGGSLFWVQGDGVASVPVDGGGGSVFVPAPTGARALTAGPGGVFFANDLTPVPSTLYAANDGGASLIVTTLAPLRAMAVDGTKVYVLSESAGTIDRIDTVARTQTTIVSRQHLPVSLALDDRYVYWMTRGDPFADGIIMRAPK